MKKWHECIPGLRGEVAVYLYERAQVAGAELEAELGPGFLEAMRAAAQFLAVTPRGDCSCPAIQAADPLRHFSGCPLRAELPPDHSNAEGRVRRERDEAVEHLWALTSGEHCLDGGDCPCGACSAMRAAREWLAARNKT